VAAVALAVVVGGGFGAVALFGKGFGKSHADLVLFKVKYEDLPLTIVEKGTLESQNNNDIVVRVKARAQGTNVASTIKWVIDDGSHVVKDRPLSEVRTIYRWNEGDARYEEETVSGKGFVKVVKVPNGNGGFTYSDLLADLDDSGLQDQLKTKKIDVDKAESDKVKAEEDYNIQLSQNESDIAAAKNKLHLDQLELEKYTEGDYPASLKQVLGNIKVGESDVEQQRERVAWMQRMVKRGYQTQSTLQSEQSRLESLELTLAKYTEDKRVLTRYTKEKEEATRKQAVEESDRALDRTKSQARAKAVQARTLRDSTKRVWQQQSDQYKDIIEEIHKTKLYAPQDGMVVYYVSEQNRFNIGRQAVVAQGEQVTEGQKLMQIPDLQHMAITAKVHEALVSRVGPKQKAVVKCDSFPDKLLAAHIDQVATVAAQTDFWASDVKVYNTKVAIDDYLEGLKPGMSAEVTITTGATREHVLTVPVQAVLGGAEMAGNREIYVMTSHGPEKKSITIGASNDKMVEVTKGLEQGDEVVLNPKSLLGDEKVKTHEPKSAHPGKGDNGNGGEPKAGPPGAGKGPGGPGGPGAGPGMGKGGAAGPGGAGGEGKGGFQQPTDEQKKQWQENMDKLKKAKPEERKKLFEQMIPDEERRKMVKPFLKQQGVDIPD
jgi:multidrug resistance efflux pump